MQVLLLCGGHQKVIDVVGGSTELLLNNRRWELCVESSQGHVMRGPSLQGHVISLSAARSSELDVRAAAHIQRRG
jgi:hypothetical protein